MDYFIADTHFFHENVIKYENRPYENKEEMNKDLIKKWNEKVKDEDIIYHLGDVAFANKEKVKEIIKELKGEKYLIRGNHDYKTTNSKWIELGFNKTLIEGRNKNSYVLYERDGYVVALSHYPLEESENFNIHGHVHTKIHHLNQQKYLCVSVECINYEPISWEEIKVILEQRGIPKKE